MKSLFPGYYNLEEESLQSLWNTSLFVLDTNVLLDIYRFSENSAAELFKVLENIKNDLWIPYQVAKEYHDNLYNTIKEQTSKYTDAIKRLDDLQQIISNKRRHPFFVDRDIEIFSEFCSNFKTKLEKRKEEVHSLLLENQYKEKLANLLCGKINAKPTIEKLEELKKEGKRRYEEKIPPGYKDSTKSGGRMYGDFILWAEIKDYAKLNKKDVVFVTNDKKEDWFLRVDGLTICARPELIAEFQEETGQRIYICQLDGFLKDLTTYRKVDITKEIVAEIQEQQQIKQEEQTEAGEIIEFSRGEIGDMSQEARASIEENTVFNQFDDMADVVVNSPTDCNV